VALTYLVQNGDLIVHKSIRKETPILNMPIEIIYEDDDLLAVDKPPSIPVHPCGNFLYNSLTGILE
jgi:tRNA pseudouridine synthase 9